MHTERITTESGTTVLSSNDRYHGPRNLPLLYPHGGPGSPRLEAVDQIDYDGPVFTYAQFGCGGISLPRPCHSPPDCLDVA